MRGALEGRKRFFLCLRTWTGFCNAHGHILYTLRKSESNEFYQYLENRILNRSSTYLSLVGTSPSEHIPTLAGPIALGIACYNAEEVLDP